MELLRTQKSPKKTLAFWGDGINDAPVSAIADVGIAMGGLGSDAAIEAADVVLMTDEPVKLVEAVKIARFTTSCPCPCWLCHYGFNIATALPYG